MAKTKIRISPHKGDRVQLFLEIEGISKEKLIEVDNSYLLEVKNASKSGNELLFTIFFNKRFFTKKLVKEGNPRITMVPANKLLTIQITTDFHESEIGKSGSRLLIEKEVAGEMPLTIKFNVTEKYYQKKIAEKKEYE
ncbi:hypothetical protein [Schinkia azotoformans]|uniref:hypothetical protein n=1 Tax=Schinkia azotoformans TaxID=1454 RepID=UPI002DB62C36|nr:hypothetical protein [Schinkia azotoformans]MEC1721776.1 hypothetical protein [Schinkia azotoformans]MED4414960.1 hypothetical protein [Schinkia azotoformans]